ncbi:nicotinate-nucleotide diphosphorylase (carboxylating), partial [Francisella tularensis subsp. holarctica]|nr:nicotinate-nucleotide diphosphorylase (carboxylating) [Francisella tularensis subsp. holarctica]
KINKVPNDIITRLVRESVAEDIATGYLTAQLAEDIDTTAFCITREEMILCGQDFANELINQLDKNIQIPWLYSDAQKVPVNVRIFELKGKARSIL